jgi:oligoribonuclease NrnB/cAMP/cGMP phosphodiesterase (DHH superfamily)
MKLLLGKQEDFINFLNSISQKDKIGIISHTDLDGIASAILMQEIIKSKKLKIKSLNFTDYGKGMFEKIKIPENITKIFILDINVSSDYEGFKKLKEKFDVFLIDHHPSNIEKQNNIIKLQTEDCVTFAIYKLAEENFNLNKWKELVCATMISEFSYKNKSNFQFIKKIYPEISIEKLYNSKPGETAKIISSALTYFKKPKKVFALLIADKIRKLDKSYEILEKEILSCVDKFKKGAEFFSQKNLYFFYYTPQFDIGSTVTTILSKGEENKTFIFVSDVEDSPGFLKVSSRNQSGKEDMNILMKKGISGLENASGGGHVPAAGARFMKKDLRNFKENILNC